MAQQTINVGAAANDRTGDTWRAAMVKVNENTAELYNKEIQNRVVVNSASDFPTAVGGKIPLADNTEYYIASNAISVADEFTVGSNNTISGAGGPALLTYTGTGAMFEGDGVGLFAIKGVALDLPNGGELLGIGDTVQSSVINVLDYRIISCGGLGTTTGVLATVFEFGTIVDADQGLVIAGSQSVVSIDKMFAFSTEATFKCVDLGSATASTFEFRDMAVSAPSGAYGISGLASNGNVAADSVAVVEGCEFLGGMTPLENITVDDYRWLFSGNTGLADTAPDCMVSLSSNATETNIAATDTPVLVAGTWVVERESHYTATVGGRATYDGERDIATPIDVTLSVEPATGTNKDITVYLAKNGTVYSASGMLVRADAGSPVVATTMWQDVLSEDDYIEVFVENNTDTVNIVVGNAVLRVR